MIGKILDMAAWAVLTPMIALVACSGAALAFVMRREIARSLMRGLSRLACVVAGVFIGTILARIALELIGR